MRRQTPAERAAQLQWQIAVSESNRRVKLASRPDAERRLVLAESKRTRRRQWRQELALREEYRI